ncbi:hypothetical protein CEN50_21620 [Fischerella thermalis CCMEE 5268]|uniref:Uncharacterized protein n=1 Tax=Fischerella thermalis CCMEE 5268 TaxID=2019662 RepID=A0A2N6KB43_9CYAN|nr:hypothetical protein [Fischerella thermalis]PLZ95677.1 hypothetical protein CEN50_21620 [Fischerella thermalis CCMEE 5268]
MKYFFLSEGWTIGRVWASEGLWQITAWRRQPDIQRMNICLLEEGEVMWLYRVEDAVITVEVKPITSPQTGVSNQAIGQVILRRLMSAEQVIERLETASARCQLQSLESVVQ